MNKEVGNAIWRLQCALDDLRSCDQYDFAEDDADDLDKLHGELEALYTKSDETIFDLKEVVHNLWTTKRREEELEDYESESRHRIDLNNWWNSTRM